MLVGAPEAGPRLHADADRRAGRRGGGGRGPGADRAADGGPRARPAAARRRRRGRVRNTVALASTPRWSARCASGSRPRRSPPDDARHRIHRHRRPARAGVRHRAGPVEAGRVGDHPPPRQRRRRRRAARGLRDGPDAVPARRQLQGEDGSSPSTSRAGAPRGRAAGPPTPTPARVPAVRPRRRRHPLRVRERVQGAGRVPRQGRVAGDRGRRAPARGQRVARRA